MAEERKLHVAFNWVIYMASSFQPPEEWFKTIDRSTGPLLDIYDQHRRVKSNFSVGGWVARWLSENRPDFVERLRGGVAEKRFEIVNRPYFHATMSMLAYDEAADQIQRSMDINERIWGVRPVGAHHNGWPWDPVTAKALVDSGVAYQLLANWQLVNYTDPPLNDLEATYRAAKLRTIEESTISSLFVSFSRDDIGIPQEMSPLHFLKVLSGKRPVDHFKRGIERIQESNTEGDKLVLLFNDSEVFWRDPHTGATGLTQLEMEDRFEEILSFLEDCPYVEFTTCQDYLKKFPPTQTYFLRPSVSPFSPGQGFDAWADGAFKQAYNLNIQCARATEDIHITESVIRLAEKMGADVEPAKSILENARENLMLSKTAVGRALAPREAVSIWCAEYALSASREARRAIDAIEFPSFLGGNGKTSGGRSL